MVLGTRPGAADASVALASEASVHIPHELPGQDPEGGSEVNFGDDSSSAAVTPRESSRGPSDGGFNEHVLPNGLPKSPEQQVS